MQGTASLRFIEMEDRKIVTQVSKEITPLIISLEKLAWTANMQAIVERRFGPEKPERFKSTSSSL